MMMKSVFHIFLVFAVKFMDFLYFYTTILVVPCSIKHPGLNFPQKFIKQHGLFQVLRASVHENQGNLKSFEKIFI